jgi:hypothetical protein
MTIYETRNLYDTAFESIIKVMWPEKPILEDEFNIIKQEAKQRNFFKRIVVI